MIHLVIKTQWDNTKLDNKILETQSIKNKDIVFIGTGNSMTKCVEYAEKESITSDDKTLYHIYSIRYIISYCIVFYYLMLYCIVLNGCVLYQI